MLLFYEGRYFAAPSNREELMAHLRARQKRDKKRANGWVSHSGKNCGNKKAKKNK